MLDHIVESATTIALAIAGVAILAVLVSRRSQTPAVIGTAGDAFSQSLNAAEAPVFGAAEQPGYALTY